MTRKKAHAISFTVNLILAAGAIFLAYLPIMLDKYLKVVYASGGETFACIANFVLLGFFLIMMYFFLKTIIKVGISFSILIGSKRLENFFKRCLKSFPLAPKHSV